MSDKTETQKIADVVVAAVRAATAPLLERIAVLEARAPGPDPAGESRLVVIEAQIAAVVGAMATHRAEMTSREASVDALTSRVAADVLHLRTELDVLQSAAPDDLTADELPGFIAACLAEAPGWQP